MMPRPIRCLLSLCVAGGLLGLGIVAAAEEPSGLYDSGPQRPRADRRSPPPDAERPEMGGMMDEMMRQGMQRMAAGMAAFARAYYQALMDQGFSSDEALKIVEGADFPSFGPHL